MPRLIDAEQFRGKHDVAELYGKLTSVIEYADIVAAPTVDAVEVVRCRECYYSGMVGKICLYCIYHSCGVDADGYCSNGKRKDGDG